MINGERLFSAALTTATIFSTLYLESVSKERCLNTSTCQYSHDRSDDTVSSLLGIFEYLLCLVLCQTLARFHDSRLNTHCQLCFDSGGGHATQVCLLPALVNSDKMRGSLCPATHRYGEPPSARATPRLSRLEAVLPALKTPSGLVSSLPLLLACDLLSVRASPSS
jgi:hypothetical protein